MIKDIKLKPAKTVSFKTQRFCTPTKKSQERKHRIYPAKNIGFSARNTDLRGGHGVQRLTMDSDTGVNEISPVMLGDIDGTAVSRVFTFSTHQYGQAVNAIIIVTERGMYYSPLFGQLPIVPFYEEIKSFDAFAYSYSKDKDYIFAANEDGLFIADQGLWFSRVDLNARPKLLKIHAHRLFVLDSDKKTIHFSAALDMTDFSPQSGQSGSVKLDGTLGKIIGLDIFENKLLITQQFGFSILDTAYDCAEFKLTTLARSYEEITASTACVLGDTIFFLTSGGMCKFENGKVELLDIEIVSSESGVSATATVHNNKYYLACGDTLLIIEKFFDSYSYIEGVKIRAFEKIWNNHCSRLGILTDETSHIYQLDESGKIGNAKVSKVWESDDFALGYATTVQYIKQILIKTATPIELVVLNNRSEQKIRVAGSTEIQKINLNFKGESFKIRIISDEVNPIISALTVVVGFSNSGVL